MVVSVLRSWWWPETIKMRAQGKHIILGYKKTRNCWSPIDSFVDDKPRIGTSIVS